MNGTKIVELHQESLEKRYLCSSGKTPVVPDDDDVIECACGYMESKEGATPNSVINVTILGQRKHIVNSHVNLDQIEACYNPKNDLLKKEKGRKLIKTDVNMTYDKDDIHIISLEDAKLNNKLID